MRGRRKGLESRKGREMGGGGGGQRGQQDGEMRGGGIDGGLMMERLDGMCGQDE